MDSFESDVLVQIIKNVLCTIMLTFTITLVNAKNTDNTNTRVNKSIEDVKFEQYKKDEIADKIADLDKSTAELTPINIPQDNGEEEIIQPDAIEDLSKQLTNKKQDETQAETSEKPIIINDETLKKSQDAKALTTKKNHSFKSYEGAFDSIEQLSNAQKTKYRSNSKITAHPLPSSKRTSNFGYRRIFGRSQFHKGVDFAAKYGSAIYAAGDGKVVIAGWLRGYGRVIYIDHGDGLQTRYAHNSRLLVKKGQSVKAGQKISEMGCSGRCTGPHLHFEVRINGKAKNPNDYLDGL